MLGLVITINKNEQLGVCMVRLRQVVCALHDKLLTLCVGALLIGLSSFGIYLLKKNSVPRSEFDSVAGLFGRRLDDFHLTLTNLRDQLSTLTVGGDRQRDFLITQVEQLTDLLTTSKKASPTTDEAAGLAIASPEDAAEKTMPIPPEEMPRVKRFIVLNQEHENWSVSTILSGDFFSGARPLTAEQREILDLMILKHKMRMNSLFERFHSVMDDHIVNRIDGRDYDTVTQPAVRHEAGRSLATVVIGNKYFSFPASNYADLAAIQKKIVATRQEMALDVIKYVDTLNQ